MKQTFTIKQLFAAVAVFIAATVLITACNTRQEETKPAEVLSAVDSAAYEQFQAWKDQQAGKALQAHTTAKKQSSVSGSNTANTTTGTGNAPAATTKKKGWSNTAKGAVIGGVGGAVSGGVVNKRNRAAGAVIGGVTGAVTGVIIGHTIDKKQGRS